MHIFYGTQYSWGMGRTCRYSISFIYYLEEIVSNIYQLGLLLRETNTERRYFKPHACSGRLNCFSWLFSSPPEEHHALWFHDSPNHNWLKWLGAASYLFIYLLIITVVFFYQIVMMYWGHPLGYQADKTADSKSFIYISFLFD